MIKKLIPNKDYKATTDYIRRLWLGINQLFDDAFMAEYIQYLIDAGKITPNITDRGLRFVQLTTIQRNALTAPQKSETIYNLTTNKLETYNGTTWNVLY